MTVDERDPRNVEEADFPSEGPIEHQIEFLLNYATLAPSGHNTQPWLFKIHGDLLEIYADRMRALPVVDPFDRELIISCGAAMFTLEAAARHFGLTTTIIPSASTDSEDLVARLRMKQAASSNNVGRALFDAIKRRQTNRSKYINEELSATVIDHCRQTAAAYKVELHSAVGDSKKAQLAELVAEGDRIQFDDPRFRRELASWVHSSRLGSKDGMSGAGFGMPDVLAPIARFVIRTFDLGDGIAAADADKIVSGSPALLLFATPDDDKAAWVSTGRALAHVSLLLTSLGYVVSYLNQPIETEKLITRVQKVFAMEAMPQILLRVGRTDTVLEPSQRRPVSEVLMR